MRKVVFAMPSWTSARSIPTRMMTIEDMYQHAGTDFEIVLVDNDTQQPGETDIRILGGDVFVKSVSFGKNVGIPRSVNYVWRKHHSKETILGFCGDNFAGTRNWLKKCVELMESTDEIGICYPVVSMSRAIEPLERAGIHPSSCSPWGDAKWVHSISVPTKAILVKPGVVDKIGFFEERLKHVGCNDYDYKRRASDAGFKVAAVYSGAMLHRIGVDKYKYASWKDSETKKSVKIYREIRKDGDLYVP